MQKFSALNRTTTIEELQNTPFDLVIIGGGITGAGIALDAAARGMTVALLEKNDFASGTSSKSTKLIHGGLRYLKKLEIKLVREVGRERATVHHIAPHLVIPEKMLLPLVKGGTYGKWVTALALWVYDKLAGVKGKDKRVMLSKEETLQKAPLLKDQDLIGSGYYAEYRTNDARLTLENIKTAISKGAICINYVKAENFIYDASNNIEGVKCFDELTKMNFQINAKYVINATGPWVDELRIKDDAKAQSKMFLSKGSHIVVPRKRFPLHQSVYFDVGDTRMVFAIPRHRAVYIGTTDTKYVEDIDNILVQKAEVEYLLAAANRMFSDINLQIKDVESTWAGLRPLILKRGKSAGELSRKDEIFLSKNGLITIAGGKLTGYRKMAERVVDLLAVKYKQRYKKTFKRVETENIHLVGGPFHNQAALSEYEIELTQKLAKLELKGYWPKYLLETYGRQSDIILKKIQTFKNEAPETALIRAETWFAIHHEMCFSLLDFFSRRTGRLYFDLPEIENLIAPVSDDFASYLAWSKQEKEKQEGDLREVLREAVAFE